MATVLRQTWWAPVAAALVLAQLLLAIAFGLDADDEDAESTVVGIVIALAGAVAIAVGLWKRPQARRLGNLLIVLGSVLAAIWFWTLVLPILAVVVVGLVVTEIRAPRRGVETA